MLRKASIQHGPMAGRRITVGVGLRGSCRPRPHVRAGSSLLSRRSAPERVQPAAPTAPATKSGSMGFAVGAGGLLWSGSPGALLPRDPQNRACDFHRTRLKQAREDPLPQTPYVVLGLVPVNLVPVKEFVLRSVHHGSTVMSNLSFGSGVVGHHLSTGPPDPRQHPFGFGHAPVSGQLCGTEGPAITSRFPVAFRPPAFASRVVTVQIPLLSQRT